MNLATGQKRREPGRRRIQNGTEVWVMRMVMPLVSMRRGALRVMMRNWVLELLN